MENIRYGKPDALDEEVHSLIIHVLQILNTHCGFNPYLYSFQVIAAAVAAHADQFIQEFPQVQYCTIFIKR